MSRGIETERASEVPVVVVLANTEKERGGNKKWGRIEEVNVGRETGQKKNGSFGP